MSDARVAEMARQAAAEVRTRGLAKGDYEDFNGCMCTLGLISFVESGDPTLPVEPESNGHRLAWALREHLGLMISEWNDAPERTAEDVALMFERVAEQYDSAAGGSVRDVARTGGISTSTVQTWTKEKQ